MKFYIACLLISIVTILNSQTKIDIAAIETYIEDFAMEDQFNGTILFISSDSIHLQKHFGYKTAKNHIFLDEKSMFNTGSIAKTIVSYAILNLIEEGKLNIDDKISHFFPQLPHWNELITVKDLLEYKSGLPIRSIRSSYTDSNLWKELINLDSLNQNTYTYSNYNNFLQAKIVEVVSKVKLKDFTYEQMFLPNKLQNSIFTNYPPEIENQNITRSYSNTYGDDLINNPNVLKFKLCFAPIYMTVNDIYFWLRFMVINYNPDSNLHLQFYSQESIDNPGPLGEIVLRDGGVDSFNIAGQSYNFLVRGYYRQTNDTYLIVATNRQEFGQIEEFQEALFSKFNIH